MKRIEEKITPDGDGIFNVLRQSANNIPNDNSEEDKKVFRDTFKRLANNTNFKYTTAKRYIWTDTSKENIDRLEKLFKCKIKVVSKRGLCEIIWTKNKKNKHYDESNNQIK